MIQYLEFDVCSECYEHLDELPDVLETSSASFDMCAACCLFIGPGESAMQSVVVAVETDKVTEEQWNLTGGDFQSTRYPVARERTELPSGYSLASRTEGVALYRDMPERDDSPLRVGSYVSEPEAIEAAWADADGHPAVYFGNPNPQ